MMQTMQSKSTGAKIEERLSAIMAELATQGEVGAHFPKSQRSFEEQLASINEYIQHAGEYGVAYEAIVAMLESHPFNLSGKSAIKLLEVGLIMGFKTDRPEDKEFDKSKG